MRGKQNVCCFLASYGRKWKLMGVRTVLTLGMHLGNLLAMHIPQLFQDLAFFNAFCMQFITIIVSMLSLLSFFFSTSMYAFTETCILFLFPINNNNPDKRIYGCSSCMGNPVKTVFSFQNVNIFFLFITWQLETDSVIPLQNLSKDLVTFFKKTVCICIHVL